MEKIQVIFSQRYDDGETVEGNRAQCFEYIQEVFEYCQYQIVAPESMNYDMELMIDVIGKSIDWNESGPGYSVHLYKAKLEGRMFLKQKEKTLYSIQFPDNLFGPTQYSPPYYEAFRHTFPECLLKLILHIKGPEPIVSILRDNKSIFQRVAYRVIMNSYDPRILDLLINALKDTKLYKILFSYLKSNDGLCYITRALKEKTGKELGKNYKKWQKWLDENSDNHLAT